MVFCSESEMRSLLHGFSSAALLCLCLAFSLSGCAQNDQPPMDSSAAEAKTATENPNKNRYYVSTSRQAKDIKTSFPYDIALLSMDSSALNTADLMALNGKPTVLAFWLTTCHPCRVELGDYAKKVDAWQNDTPYNLFAVSIDFPDRFGQVKKFATQQDWPFPFVWDIDREFKEVLPGRLNGLPQVFLFDAEGNLVYQHKKYLPGDDDRLFEEVKKAAGK